MEYIFSDQQRKIAIEAQIIIQGCFYRQLSWLSKEAGGILIGREVISTNNLIIDQMTEPMPRDKRNRFRFLRRDNGHIEYFEQLYCENENIYGYVGEWHTHPEKVPSYSAIDYREWDKIVREKPGNMPIYCLIFGTEKWRVWKVEASHKPEMIYENDCITNLESWRKERNCFKEQKDMESV